VEVRPEWQSQVEEPVPAPDVAPPPEAVEEAVAPIESNPLLESTGVETPKEQQEESPQPDTSDTLWQRWLSRVSSMLSARSKRRTLTPKEPLPESETVVTSLHQMSLLRWKYNINYTRTQSKFLRRSAKSSVNAANY
jgi:hypothetical protein